MSFFEFPHTRTYDTDLGWLIKKVTSYDDTIAALDAWIDETEPKIEELMEFKAALESGNLPEGVAQAIRDWLSIHALDLIGELVKMVFFGITDDGYFVAYIPESWEDIIFGTTGLDDFPSGIDYGHLTLSLNIGG